MWQEIVLVSSKTLQQKVNAICYQAEANDADHHNSQGPDEKKSQTRHNKSLLIPARTELGFKKQIFASNISAVTPDMNIKSMIIIDSHIFHSNYRYVSSSQQSPSLINTMIATSHHQWSHHISLTQWSLCLIINDNQIRSLHSSDQSTYLHSPRSPTVEETSTPSLLSSMITLGGWGMITCPVLGNVKKRG